MEVKEVFGSVPGEEAGRVMSFLLCVGGEKEKGGVSTRKSRNLGFWVTVDRRGTEKDIPVKPTAVFPAAG